MGRDGGGSERKTFTDTQADGEKSRDVKRQTHADGERGGSRERQRQTARETLIGKCRETERVFKNKFRKYFPLVSKAFILNFSQRVQMPSLAPHRASRNLEAGRQTPLSGRQWEQGSRRSQDKKQPHLVPIWPWVAESHLPLLPLGALSRIWKRLQGALL